MSNEYEILEITPHGVVVIDALGQIYEDCSKKFEKWCDKVCKDGYSGWFKWNSGFNLLNDENIDTFIKPQYQAEVKKIYLKK